MKTPADWEDWCDAVWHVRGSYPTWHELVNAIQEDACGTSQLKNGTSAAPVAIALLAGVTSPDYGAGALRLGDPLQLPMRDTSCGSAPATAEGAPASSRQTSEAATPSLAGAHAGRDR